MPRLKPSDAPETLGSVLARATVKVGDRVQLTEKRRDFYLTKGLEPSHVARMSVPGTVVHVSSSARHHWTSVRVRQDTGAEHTFFPDELEPAEGRKG